MLWNYLGWIGGRNLAGIAKCCLRRRYGATRFYFDECEDRVALTIDDAPGHTSHAFSELLDVLKLNSATCTFLITSSYAKGNEEMTQLLKRAVEEGHELGNHMPEDRPYHLDSKQ